MKQAVVWTFGALLLIGCAFAEDFRSVYLWPDGAPGAVGEQEKDKPRLTVHPADEPNGAAVIVNPGGGYSVLTGDHEGLQVARFLNRHGIAAFVLRYRLMPGYQPSVSLQDAQRAVRCVRHYADKYGVDPDRIGMLGFSAGGHLATAVATAKFERTSDDQIDRESARPDFIAPIYPVTSRKLLKFEMGDYASTAELVTKDTPPTFLVHSNEDVVVDASNSIVFYQALHKNKVPAELHVFGKGMHGLALAPQDPNFGQWPQLFIDWLQRGGWLTDTASTAVSGRVTVDGEPLFLGAVEFVPVNRTHRTSVAEVRWRKDGKFQTPPNSPLSVGTYQARVHRFATDEVAPWRGEYSVPDATKWDVPGVLEIVEGMDPIELAIESAR